MHSEKNVLVFMDFAGNSTSAHKKKQQRTEKASKHNGGVVFTRILTGGSVNLVFILYPLFILLPNNFARVPFIIVLWGEILMMLIR